MKNEVYQRPSYIDKLRTEVEKAQASTQKMDSATAKLQEIETHIDEKNK